MKFSLALAAALFLPVLVNAQNQNGTVAVSGVLSTVPIVRLTDWLLRSELARVWCSTLRTLLLAMAPT